MKVKEMIRQSRINWNLASEANPALKASGQTEFTWENYYRLEKKAKDYDNKDVNVLGDES